MLLFSHIDGFYNPIKVSERLFYFAPGQAAIQRHTLEKNTTHFYQEGCRIHHMEQGWRRTSARTCVSRDISAALRFHLTLKYRTQRLITARGQV